MTSVFLTGATGYIGGQTLTHLIEHNSPGKYVVRALVRDDRGAKKVTEKYPQVQIVPGNLDDAALIEEEAAKADVVLNLASNKHVGSLQAIQRGFLKRGSSPAYWVQVSGASALGASEIASPSFVSGEASDEIFDDVNDIDKIRSLVRAHSSRAVDNFILDVAKNHPWIRTAIVMPPIIYGKGDGPVNQRSVQIPSLSSLTIERQHGVRVGKGLSRWGSVHISDLGKLIAALVDAAANGSKSTIVWGEEGIYLPSTAEFSFGKVSELVAQAAYEQGLIKTTELEEVDGTLADKLLPRGSVFFGSNARIKSQRGAKGLSWAPTHQSLEEDVPRVVADEALRRKQQSAP